MKISEVISELTELQKELGDVKVLVFQQGEECDDIKIKEVDSIERINIGTIDKPKMAVSIDA